MFSINVNVLLSPQGPSFLHITIKLSLNYIKYIQTTRIYSKQSMKEVYSGVLTR